MRLDIDPESGLTQKTIPPERDRRQSAVLTGMVGFALVFCVARSLIPGFNPGFSFRFFAIPLAISLLFGWIVWYLRAATADGVVTGVLICFLLQIQHLPSVGSSPAGYSALAALVAVFVISFAATRFGRARKETNGLAEARHGRRASQIAANLGAAALFAAMGQYPGCIAALAEAGADTASSEVGQALGGPVRLLSSWKTVPVGTDGGISVGGTFAGILSAAIVTFVGGFFHFTLRHALITFSSAVAGLLFDSVLGATVERKGWIGNDLVNFASTLFAALLAGALT